MSLTSNSATIYAILLSFPLATLARDRNVSDKSVSTPDGSVEFTALKLTHVPALTELRGVLRNNTQKEQVVNQMHATTQTQAQMNAANSKTPNLDQFTTNLTERAQPGLVGVAGAGSGPFAGHGRERPLDTDTDVLAVTTGGAGYADTRDMPQGVGDVVVRKATQLQSVDGVEHYFRRLLQFQ